MRLFKITNGFDRMTDAYLVVRANFIHASVGGSGNFPTPTPSLTDLQATITAFTTAVQKAEGGSSQDVTEKNAVRQQLIDMLHLLGNYVLFTAAGDQVIAKSSGFHISKLPQPLAPLTVPQGLVLENGLNKGELLLKFNRVAGAKSYVYEITPSPVTADSLWERSMNTIVKKAYSGLESGKEYNCRVAAVGNKEQVVYSAVVSRIAL